MAVYPEHPFWNYSLGLYGRQGVGEACVELQDEFDLDVNIVLFCLWAGAEGPGALTAEEVSECMARGGQWQREVVQRLRYVRRLLKRDQLGAASELVQVLRPEVQAVEISAEHVEQLMLAQIVPLERNVKGPDVAVKNLQAYFRAAGVAPNGNSSELVQTILVSAFPQTPAEQLRSSWEAA